MPVKPEQSKRIRVTLDASSDFVNLLLAYQRSSKQAYDVIRKQLTISKG
jgi:hypothetical protein